MMAPIREPGLFKCAFGYVGVYDVDMLFKRGDKFANFGVGLPGDACGIDCGNLVGRPSNRAG